MPEFSVGDSRGMVAIPLGWCENQMKTLGIHFTTYLAYGSFSVTPVSP